MQVVALSLHSTLTISPCKDSDGTSPFPGEAQRRRLITGQLASRIAGSSPVIYSAPEPESLTTKPPRPPNLHLSSLEQQGGTCLQTTISGQSSGGTGLLGSGMVPLYPIYSLRHLGSIPCAPVCTTLRAPCWGHSGA